MTAYALGFVVACFVGMFVAGVITDALNRRADRVRANRVEETRRTLAYIADVQRLEQATSVETARLRAGESA